MEAFIFGIRMPDWNSFPDFFFFNLDEFAVFLRLTFSSGKRLIATHRIIKRPGLLND